MNLTTIPQPYQQMLSSLSQSKGYGEFRNFIDAKINSSNDWKAEVKALFEIEKPSHGLIRICSQKKSEPEGIFELGGETAILEVAHIGYLFNRNEQKLALINRVTTSFNPLLRSLNGAFTDYAIIITIPSIQLNPAQALLTEQRKVISAKFSAGEHFTLKLLNSKSGTIDVGPYENLKSLVEGPLPREAVQIIIRATGRIERAFNAELNSKIEQVLKIKRKQHLGKYKENVKLYYLFIDCPIDKLKTIDETALTKRLSSREVLVICAIEGKRKLSSGDVWFIEHKILLGDSCIIDTLDLTNPYFESVRL